MRVLQNIIKPLLISCILFGFFSCELEDKENSWISRADDSTETIWRINKKEFNGTALGTSLIVKTSDEFLKVTPAEIDSIITSFNQELSTYIPQSLISQFNAQGTSIDLNKTAYFKECFELSQQVFEITEGAFDPTVFPLVELWGFFRKVDVLPTQEEIDSVLNFVDFSADNLYAYKEGILTKKEERLKLVFNAIAKGQAVDVLAKFLMEKNQENFYVEIGGELYVKGKNNEGNSWVIGVDVPSEENSGLEGMANRTIENKIQLSNKGMATSGNYRDYYEMDGIKYSHTLHPKAGRPIRQEILSATVIAENTAVADAYATAFMVLGVEKSMELLQNHPELQIEAYLLYDNQGYLDREYTPGMEAYLLGEK